MAHAYKKEIIALAAKKYFSRINKYVFSPFLLLIPLLIGSFSYKKTGEFFLKDKILWKKLSLLLLFILINLLFFIFIGLYPFFRYLTPILPIFLLVISLIIKYAIDFNKIFGIAVIVVLVLLSGFHNYLYEITHDYDGPIEGIVKYLNENGTENDTVVMPYGDLPLKFYTKMRVVGAVGGEDWSEAKEADWIVWRKYLVTPKDDKEFKLYLLRHVNWSDYQKIFIDYPDIPFENRENPDYHKFRTVENEDRVVIYRKIR
jgi:hypothetical protein